MFVVMSVLLIFDDKRQLDGCSKAFRKKKKKNIEIQKFRRGRKILLIFTHKILKIIRFDS